MSKPCRFGIRTDPWNKSFRRSKQAFEGRGRSRIRYSWLFIQGAQDGASDSTEIRGIVETAINESLNLVNDEGTIKWRGDTQE